MTQEVLAAPLSVRLARARTAAEGAEFHTLLRVALLVRMLILLAALVGIVGSRMTVIGVGAVVVLALTSMVGLAMPAAAGVLQRHPLLAIGDIALSTGLLVGLGVDNPLVLVTLGTAVVVGLVMTAGSAALSTVVLVGGYVIAALASPDRGFAASLALPCAIVVIVVMGQAFRVVALRKRQSERALADAVTGAAAAAERARLARELHDSTAKTLQGLSLGARSLGAWIDRDPARATAHAQDIADAADAAVGDLRRLLSSLRQDRPDLPFRQTLSAVAREVGDSHGIRVVADLDDVVVTDPAVRYELLAAGREALTNAAAHAGVDSVGLRLREESGEVVVEVRDTGAGFDPEALHESERDGHFGVRGYTERMAAVGGSATVTSTIGQGTTVRLATPAAGLREPLSEGEQ